MSASDRRPKPLHRQRSLPHLPAQLPLLRHLSFESAPLQHQFESRPRPLSPPRPAHLYISLTRRAQTPTNLPDSRPPPHEAATPPLIPPTTARAPSQKFRAPQSPRESALSRKTPPQNPPLPSAPTAANQKSSSSQVSLRRARPSVNSTNLRVSACRSPAA